MNGKLVYYGTKKLEGNLFKYLQDNNNKFMVYDLELCLSKIKIQNHWQHTWILEKFSKNIKE